MSAPLFNIIVSGVRKGFDPVVVKANFSSTFKLDTVQVDRVFKSVPIILRRNIREDFADSFVKRLLAMGVSAKKVNADTVPLTPKIIYIRDKGETSSDASAMHQPVDFFYSEHERRIPFVFTGKGLAYCKIWVVNLIVCLLSAGILYPWARARSLSYLYEQTSLNHVNFQCQKSSSKVYFFQLLLMASLFALGIGFLYSYIYFAIGLVVCIAVFPYYWFKRNLLQQEIASYHGLPICQVSTLRDTYMTMFVWPFLAFATAGLLTPSATFNIHRSQVIKKSLCNYELTFSVNPKKYWVLLPPLLLAELTIFACVFLRQHLPVYAVLTVLFSLLLFIFIHWQVALAKLQWNHLSFPLGYFVCSWTLGGYGKLLAKNWLLCVLTLGLYWPWAKISITKYKTEQLAFFANQRFNKWRKGLNDLG